MLSVLESIVEVIEFIPQYVILAIETVFNLLSAAVGAIFTAASTLIELPAIPAAPEFIEAINWFFPIGSIVAIMLPIVGGYIAFLAVRWIYAKVGQL